MHHGCRRLVAARVLSPNTVVMVLLLMLLQHVLGGAVRVVVATATRRVQVALQTLRQLVDALRVRLLLYSQIWAGKKRRMSFRRVQKKAPSLSTSMRLTFRDAFLGLALLRAFALELALEFRGRVGRSVRVARRLGSTETQVLSEGLVQVVLQVQRVGRRGGTKGGAVAQHRGAASQTVDVARRSAGRFSATRNVYFLSPPKQTCEKGRDPA